MKWILKGVSAAMLWGVAIYIVVYIDPESVKDIGVEGAYLPFLAAILTALWYTVMIVMGSGLTALVVTALLGLALVLSMNQLLTWFTMTVIGIMIVFLVYLLQRRSSANKSD
jgi:hypothetical protein